MFRSFPYTLPLGAADGGVCFVGWVERAKPNMVVGCSLGFAAARLNPTYLLAAYRWLVMNRRLG